MRRGFFKRLRNKGRKYPIKRDQLGRSARCRAFQLFDKGMRPAEVAPRVGVSTKTACRYYQDWKKRTPRLELRYGAWRYMLKNHPDLSEHVIRTLVSELDMPLEEVMLRLERPWGLKQLLLGKWPDYTRERRLNSAESRLQAALLLVHLVEASRIPPEQLPDVVKAVIKGVLKEASLKGQQGSVSITQR